MTAMKRPVKAFRTLAETKRPARSEVSSIVFEDYDGDVMKIGEFAQFCSIVQLNKAIPVLLDMRDDGSGEYRYNPSNK